MYMRKLKKFRRARFGLNLMDHSRNQNDLGTGRVATHGRHTITATHNRSIVFARWRQCARQYNARFLGPTARTMPTDSSIDSVCYFCTVVHRSSLPASFRFRK